MMKILGLVIAVIGALLAFLGGALAALVAFEGVRGSDAMNAFAGGGALAYVGGALGILGLAIAIASIPAPRATPPGNYPR